MGCVYVCISAFVPTLVGRHEGGVLVTEEERVIFLVTSKIKP